MELLEFLQSFARQGLNVGNPRRRFSFPGAMPQAAEALNLSFLSEYEQELVLEVLRRDEELRQAEDRRVR